MINRKTDELVICTIKNIADFDFTAALGAMYNGRSYLLKAGETLQAPEPAAYRMAVNLAKAMLIKKCPPPTIGNGDDRQVLGSFTDDDVEKIVPMIIISTTREEAAPKLDEAARIAARIDELNKRISEMENAPAQTGAVGGKAEVIAELEKKGIKFDRRQGKAALEKLLAESVA